MLQWGANIIAVIYNAPIKAEETCRAIYIQQVFPAHTAPVMFRHSTEAKFNMCVEKNWIPIGPTNDSNVHYNQGFLFAYSVQPFHVIRCFLTGRCHTVSSTDNLAIPHYYQQLYAHIPNGREARLTLGTNAVRLSDKYYGAIFPLKIARPAPQRAIYHSVPFIFEATHPFAIVKAALKPLELPEPDNGHKCSFIYTTGLSFVQGRLAVMYTCDDKTASIFVDTADNIFRDMIDIKDLPMPEPDRADNQHDASRKKIHVLTKNV
jgi:hypothetical protein